MGVTFLLDTHVLLWALSTPERIPEDVRDLLTDTQHGLAVSAASAWEVATKVRLGKLDAAPLVRTWDRRIAGIGASVVPISSEHALYAGEMTWGHRDPFDRMLVAQATLEDMSLVTVDDALRGLPAPRIVSW